MNNYWVTTGWWNQQHISTVNLKTYPQIKHNFYLLFFIYLFIYFLFFIFYLLFIYYLLFIFF